MVTKPFVPGERSIITRTPVRVTYAGGGTDIPTWYRNHGWGAVVNAAANRYVYVDVDNRFDTKIFAPYHDKEHDRSSVELVESVGELRNPVVREGLKSLGIPGCLQVHSKSKIPTLGTGLGGSSSFTVGFLNAAHAWMGEMRSSEELAEEAYDLERNKVGDSCGKQDQYAAAFGGINYFEFHANEKVVPEKIIMPDEDFTAFQAHHLILYMEGHRRASGILRKQEDEMEEHVGEYDKMRKLAREHRDLLRDRAWQRTGDILAANWDLKRVLSNGITNPDVDAIYRKGIEEGAEGGKLMGAGSVGFMLFFADPKRHNAIANATGLRRIDMRIGVEGSKIVYTGPPEPSGITIPVEA